MSIIRKEQLTNPLSASYALTASYYKETDPIFTAVSGTFTLTSSFNSFTSSYNTGSFTGSFTGSLFGTASWAEYVTNAPTINTGSLLTTASVNLNIITFTKGNTDQFSITVNTGSGGTVDTSNLVTTSSFNAFTSSINTFTSSYNTGSFSGSFTGSLRGTASTASYYRETDPIFVAKSASLATTGSNTFNGNQSITGSISTTKFFTTTISDTSLENFSSTSNYAGTVLSRALIDGDVVLYDIVYLETDGGWYQNNQSNNNSSKKLGICLDIDNRLILTEGHVVIDIGGTLGPAVQARQMGIPVFIREGDGTKMSCTSPTTGYVRILGHIYYQNQNTDPNLYIMRFNPSNDFYLLG